MFLSYHFSPKKSIIIAFAAVFSLIIILPAQAAIPNDAEFAKQKSMWENVGAPSAWDITTGSRRVVVAVIDTGVDTWNPDLAGNIWTNQFEIDGNGLDDDNNGYVDDLHGWNFIEKNNDVRTSVFNQQDVPEAVRHGTVAAGLIGAVGNNGRDGTGINWQVSIMPLRAVGSDGYGSMADVTEAVLYAVNNGADVISMSMVSVFSDSNLGSALRTAYDHGVLVVAAAGNRHFDLALRPHYPICYDNGDQENWIIGVAALASTTPDKLASFSDYGSCVDFLAPGAGIYSTERYAPQYGYSDAFGGPWDGTSFAAPIVAGAAALLKSIHPEWLPDKIISVLQSTADNLDSANPSLIGKIGAGRINIGRAVERANRESSFLGVDLASLYYVNDKNLLVKLNVNQKRSYVLAKTEEAEIVDLARLGNRPGGREYLAALLRRDKYYYVRFFDDSGRNLKEIALTALADKAATPNKIVWRSDILTVGYSNPKTKISYLVDYDLNGTRRRELKLKNLLDWESEPRNGYLAAVTAARSVFKWQLYNGANEVINSGNWRGYSSLEDLRLGYFWGAADLQIATMLKTANKTEWQIIDTRSKRAFTEKLPQKSGRYAAIPGLYLDHPAFFVYATGDDTYRIYNGHSELLQVGSLK